jgi:hypothetical protein
MTTTKTLVSAYLDRLREAAAELPPKVRAPLLDDIGAHLAEVLGPAAGEAQTRQVLDELGTPEEIVVAAVAESGGATTPARTGGTSAYDVITGFVLLLGGFVVPVLGWFIGVAMLWNGPRWNAREKWVGTATWPVAVLLGAAGVFAWANGYGAWAAALGSVLGFVVLGLGFAYLLRVARRRY